MISRKIIKFLTLISSFFLILLNSREVKAQKPYAGYATRCLSIDAYIKPSCPKGKNPSAPCIDLPKGEKWPNPKEKNHTARLKGTGFPTDRSIYIVGCISTKNNYVCTARTGDSKLNREVRKLGFDVTDNPMVRGGVYEFNIQKNPVTTRTGEFTVIVRSATPKSEAHLFFGVYRMDAIIEGGKGRGRTIQYGGGGNFSFAQDPKECITIHWDPTGRVFDAVSLEPLPDVRVTILNKDGTPVPPRPGFSPSKITEPDGLFSFFVQEGEYKLKAEKENYSFPVELSEIDPNYSKAYGCDFDVGKPLYNDQYIIEERGKFIRCDVPLKPVGVPYYGEVVILNFGHMRLPNGDISYTATFSHPFAIGILKGEKTGKIIVEKSSDADGKWEVVVPKDKVPENESLILETRKVSLSFVNPSPTPISKLFQQVKKTIAKFISSVFAQNFSYKKVVKFDPVLPYLEGYAYDDKGRALSNARVRIISSSTGNVLLELKADENGYFKILPQYLPMFSYYIQIQPENEKKVYSYTTSQFVKQNEKYLSSKRIDLMEIKQNGEPISFTSEEEEKFKESLMATAQDISKYQKPSLVSPTVSQSKSTSQSREVQKTRQFLWSLIAILLAFLIFTATGIYYFIKTRSKEF